MISGTVLPTFLSFLTCTASEDFRSSRVERLGFPRETPSNPPAALPVIVQDSVRPDGLEPARCRTGFSNKSLRLPREWPVTRSRRDEAALCRQHQELRTFDRRASLLPAGQFQRLPLRTLPPVLVSLVQVRYRRIGYQKGHKEIS